MKTNSFLLAAIFIAISFTFFACSSDGGGSDDGNSSSSVDNGGGESSSSGSDLPEVKFNETTDCGESYSGAYGSVEDDDGNDYKTVVIGSQTWMAENLNFETESGSACYNSIPENCETYGRLYNWEAATIACPIGWRLPTNGDWDELFRFVDDNTGTGSLYISSTAGRCLKATSGWVASEGAGGGDDYFGFAALPGGYGRLLGENFTYLGNYGLWWSSSDIEVDIEVEPGIFEKVMRAYYRGMYYHNETADFEISPKSFFYSVRCVKE